MCSQVELGLKIQTIGMLSLKQTSKSRQDEIRFTFDVTKCDRIFYYLLQEKQIKLPSNHVILSLEQLKSMHIVSGM
jgi:hypothetical protein